MSFYHGQSIIWYRQLKYDKVHQTPATFLEYQGKMSALIRADDGPHRVRLDNLEEAKEKPRLMRSGVFVS